MRRATLVAVLVAGLGCIAAPSAVAAKRPTYSQLREQVSALKESRATWKKTAQRNATRVRTARGERDAALGQVTGLRGQLAARDASITGLNGQVATLQGANSTLTTQRDQALSGLSGQVTAFVSAATSLSDVYSTILAPARAAWTCGGSTFLGSTFISVDFNRIGFCF